VPSIESPVLRLAAFAVGLLAAFGAAFGLGRAVGPLGDAAEPAPHRMPAATQPAAPGHGEHP
jgi:hypothetical protein